MTMTLTMKRMGSTLAEQARPGRRGTVENVTAPEQPGASVRLRPEIAALPPTARGAPRPPTASSSRATRTRTTRCRGVVEGRRRERARDQSLPRRVGARRCASASPRGSASPPTRCIVGAGSVSLIAQFITAAAAPGDEVVYSWRIVRGLPGARHRRRRDERAGAEPTRPQPRPRGHGGRGHRAHPGRHRLLAEQPHRHGRHRRRVRALHGSRARRPCSCCSTRPTSNSSATRRRRRAHALGRYPNLVVLRTFSKAYGLAGLRVGYAIGPAAILDAARSTAIPLSVTGRAQRAARSRRSTPRPSCSNASTCIVERRDRVARGAHRAGLADPAGAGQLRLAAHRRRHGGRRRPPVRRRPRGARVPAEGIRVSIGEEASVEILLRILGELVPASQEGAAV